MASGTRHNSRLSDAYGPADLLLFLDLAYMAGCTLLVDALYRAESRTNLAVQARESCSFYVCYSVDRKRICDLRDATLLHRVKP